MPVPTPLRSRRAATVALLGALVLALATVALLPRGAHADDDASVPAGDARTAAAIEAILADSQLPRAFWGIAVVDLGSGRTVASRNADLLMLPASTLKLLTTAAAFDALGPDFRFTTTLHHVGPEPAADGVLRGDLVLRGAGDPSFGSTGQPDALRRWAEALAEAGVRRIEGRLIGDDDRFEDALYAEGWDVSHIATESYAAPTGGIAWADNLLPVRVEGGGGRPSASGGPAGFASFLVAPAGSSRARGGLRVERAFGSDTYHITGAAPSSYRGTIRVPVGNPTLYALHAFADRLRAAGIDTRAMTLWDVDDLAAPVDVGARAPLLVHVSPPLSQLATRINHESDNLYAEHVFRALVPDGSAASAARRTTALLAAAGAATDGLAVRDGSGLSRKNLVTPTAMASMLRHMARHRHASAFRASMPSGGVARSTLRNRLGGVPVEAKTGALESVRCLAGYVDTPSGPVAFVLMANHFTVGGRQISDAQDRIVRAIAAGGRAPIDE